MADTGRVKAALIARRANADDGSDESLLDAGTLGDRSLLQNYFPQKDRVEVQKQFGRGFAESLTALTPGRWQGPLRSGYGVHLVFVEQVIEPPTMTALTLCLSDCFAFYNGERTHQALGQQTPNVVYLSSIGGGAMIVDKFGDAMVEAPVEAEVKMKPGQRRSAANEVESVA